MKNKGGHPPLYRNSWQLQKMIDQYFLDCDNKCNKICTTKEGKETIVMIPDPEPYTMAGLAYALGMCRQTLINYKNRDRFLDTIKRARDRVEKDVEIKLIKHGHAGLIFNLKNNFAWKDRTETDLTTKGQPLNVGVVTYQVP